MPSWVIEGVLATSPRPGYRPGPEQSVPSGVVEEWLLELQEFGVASILCLIGPDQLWLYRRSVPEGLLTFPIGLDQIIPLLSLFLPLSSLVVEAALHRA